MSAPDADPSLLFIGTATTLLRYGELTLLTDPNFLHKGQRAWLGRGLWSTRRTEPAVSIDELPALDAIVLSHLHGDHWDRVARRGLDRELPVVTTAHAAKHLQRQRFGYAVGLHTWESHRVSHGRVAATITSMPGRHAPAPITRLLPPVMGSMIEFGPVDGEVDLRLYITGDTLFVDDLSEIPRRFPDIDASVLHLGGTRLPGGLMVTMDGKQGADALELMRAPANVPVHFDDYGVFRSPLSDFRAEVDRRGLTDRVRFVDRGDTISLR